MKNLLAFFLLIGFSVLLFSCEKKEQCQTATLCMVNQTADTIRFCWGCNFYTEKLPPGEKACREVMGPIDESSFQYVDFQTTSGTRRILVDECYVEVSY